MSVLHFGGTRGFAVNRSQYPSTAKRPIERGRTHGQHFYTPCRQPRDSPRRFARSSLCCRTSRWTRGERLSTARHLSCTRGRGSAERFAQGAYADLEFGVEATDAVIAALPSMEGTRPHKVSGQQLQCLRFRLPLLRLSRRRRIQPEPAPVIAPFCEDSSRTSRTPRSKVRNLH